MNSQIKKLLKEAEETTEEQLAQHQVTQGHCNSRCGMLIHYSGRMELIRWLRESLDKRKKNVVPLNDLEW